MSDADNAMREATLRVMSTLTPRERKVLQMRFGLPVDDLTVEADMEVTRERLRQIEAKALRKLRHPSRSKRLKAFIENATPPDDDNGGEP